MTLTQIANKWGTDKGTIVNPFHNYTAEYAKYMEPNREKEINILEIGIRDPRFPGASLRMWKEYFPKAQVFGIDLVDCRDLEEDRINTIICNQKDRKALADIGKILPTFDYIIDDGDHTSEAQLLTLAYFICNLSTKGLYFIEDLHIKEGNITKEFIINDNIPKFINENEKQTLLTRIQSKILINTKLALIRRGSNAK